MQRLGETDVATARQRNRREATPLHSGVVNIPAVQEFDLCTRVTHRVQHGTRLFLSHRPLGNSPASGCMPASAGGTAKMSPPAPTEIERNPRTPRKPARSALGSFRRPENASRSSSRRVYPGMKDTV